MDSYSLSIVKNFVLDSIVLNDCSKIEKLSFLLSYVDSLFSDVSDETSRIELIEFTQREIDEFYSDDDLSNSD